MNQSVNWSQTIRSCELTFAVTTITIPVISIAGTVLNTLATLTFSTIIFNSKSSSSKSTPRVYYYLAWKSGVDACMLVLQCFLPLYFNSNTPTLSGSLFTQIWYVYGFNYLTDVLVGLSASLEILASIDIKFTNSSSNSGNKSIKPRTLVILLVSVFVANALFSMINIFRYHIETISDPENLSGHRSYRTVYSQYHSLHIDKYIRFIQSFVRDFLILIVIFTLNLLIFVSVRRAVNRKHDMFTEMCQLSSVKQMLARTHRAKTKAKIMVIIIGAVYVLGHVPLSINYLPFLDTSSSNTWLCFYYATWIPFYLSYAVSFFIYLKFNTQFRARFAAILLNSSRFCTFSKSKH